MIVPGLAGNVDTYTSMILAGPGPQLLFAVTEMVPLLEPTKVVMEFVVEDPVQPGGNNQV